MNTDFLLQGHLNDLAKQNETYILCKASGAIEEDSEHGVSKIVTDVLILHSIKFEERGAQI